MKVPYNKIENVYSFLYLVHSWRWSFRC
jgi:hypothetical protein